MRGETLNRTCDELEGLGNALVVRHVGRFQQLTGETASMGRGVAAGSMTESFDVGNGQSSGRREVR